MSGDTGKQYGLILPKKGGGQDVIQRPSIFDEGSDSGDSGKEGGDWIKKAYQREAAKSGEKRQTKIQIKKALSQDPSIFQYDEVYDDIKEKSNVAPKKEEKKQSRYIQSLKRNAERRKLENERRLERQVQKEREEEGEQFKDKETFVTSSYKKKLEEFQKMDEEEMRMDRLEEIGDVTKQKDISGFYRHLYKTTVDDDVKKEPKEENQKIKEEEKIEEPTVKKSPIKEIADENFKQTDGKKQKRQYRKRKRSASSREEGENTSSSSSYSSSSSSSSESEDEPKERFKKTESEKKREKTPEKSKRSASRGKENIEVTSLPVEGTTDGKKKKSDSTLDNEKNKSELVSEIQSPQKEVKPFVNIWQKRTIGAAFDDALKRYMERKSKRQGSY